MCHWAPLVTVKSTFYVVALAFNHMQCKKYDIFLHAVQKRLNRYKKCDAADMSKDSILCMTGACTTGLFFPNTKLQLPVDKCLAQPYTVISSDHILKFGNGHGEVMRYFTVIFVIFY
jgi:hypothetical protein